ncbi:MAG: fumarylacetoacetate hydrolase family protein [Sandaracinus sp.]
MLVGRVEDDRGVVRDVVAGPGESVLARAPDGRAGEPVIVRSWLPPVTPSKIIGIGANFPGDESVPGPYPSFFVKAGSAVVGHGASVPLPHVFTTLAAEGELALVIARPARDVPLDRVESYVLGYTIINDLSGRDTSLPYVPPSLKKSCDGLAPLGPWLLLDPRPQPRSIETYVNGRLAGKGNTADLTFSPFFCVAYLSSLMTLLPGDVIALGCPPPKPHLAAGDACEVRIEGLGALETRIVEPRSVPPQRT